MMLFRWRMRAMWVVLLAIALIVGNLPTTGWPYEILDPYLSNHWVHFLMYTLIVAIPVTVWKRKYRVLLSLVAVLAVIALGSLQTFIPGHINRSQNALPDLFGVAAGILLGMNLRMMQATHIAAGRGKPVRPSSELF